MKTLIDTLERTQNLPDDALLALITDESAETAAYLAQRASEVRKKWYGDEIFVRGLIEFTNYCKNDCYYCGIRCSNRKAERYRLTAEQILDCCALGYELGYRTFVLQGGEDPWWTDEKVCDLVRNIKTAHPDCAVTLSIGEKSRKSYAAYRAAGADRYLLRHETANEAHYRRLHPEPLSCANRKRCLRDLKELGYQVGAGMMVGAPGQKPEHLVEDFRFLQGLQPDMIGIGPFIPHHDTPFGNESAGSFHQTLRLLSILRLMFPRVLLPATTALGTIHPRGRELGVLAGANVVMPNLSPTDVREKYKLYENKICTGDEAAQCRGCLARRMESVGCRVVVSRGDVVSSRE